MSKKFLLCCSLILFTAAPFDLVSANYAATSETYENKRVESLDIIPENLPPNGSFDSKLVIGRLKTKVGDPFSQLTFDSDLKTLAEEYDRIDPQVEVSGGKVKITIKVWPRPLIRSITWEGNEHVKSKALKKELGIRTRSTFNRQSFNKAFNKLKEFYVKKGYFESQLQYSLVTDSKTNEVDIHVTVQEGRSGVISDITFKGFTSSEESDLLQMIYTKKYNLFLSWMTGTGKYHEEALEQDKMTIINFLQNQGYVDAKVDILVKEAAKEGKIIVEVVADRGVKFNLGRITFSGNELFSDKEIEGRFSVRPGDIYSPEKLRQTADAIKEMYGRKGYIDTNVQYETYLVEDAPIYNVSFVIEEEQEYKIGIIRIVGNSQTDACVILRESLLIPGETFDSLKLKATQQRLENIGYFKNVNVYAVRTQDDQYLGDNYRDVYIEVEETTTGNLSLFFGFSSADDLFGGLDLVENNFNYKGIGSVFSEGFSAIRGGGEYAHARASLGEKQSSYSFSWMTPYFRDTLWRTGFDLSVTRSTLQSDHYHIDTYGGSIFASYPINNLWSFGTKYRARQTINHVSKHVSKQEREDEKASGFVSAIGSSITFDSTDNPVKTHRGFRSVFETEFVGVGGGFTFLRFGYVNAYYTPLWRRGTMKYRFDLKFIEPLGRTNHANDVPVSERYFLGGENSVRGYRAFHLGPHFDNGDPKGGISSALVSIEYLHEVFRFLDLFIFADGGAVSQKRLDPGTLRLSYGFGARIELINRVPVILGMGFPVNPDGRSEVRKFFFSMGGQF